MSSQKQKTKLINTLKNAYQVCKSCGTKYGVYSVGCSSSWEGKCDVCGETKSVTEARDYGYLITGIRELTLGEETVSETTEVKYKSQIHSISITRQEDKHFLGTEVRIDDEGGGPFLTIIDDDGNEIRLDFEEFDLLVEAVRQLQNQ
jgi:predicted ATP-dependent serine protease